MTRQELNAMAGFYQLTRAAESVANWKHGPEGSERDWYAYSAEDLVKIWRAMMRSGWDVYPDQWSDRQVREALAGQIPQFKYVDGVVMADHDSPTHWV